MTELEALRTVAKAALIRTELESETVVSMRKAKQWGREYEEATVRLDEALVALATAEPDEWRQLVNLLRDHINSKYFDQFDRWRMKESMGNTVYIHLSYKPTAPEEVHVDLDAPPPSASQEGE